MLVKTNDHFNNIEQEMKSCYRYTPEYINSKHDIHTVMYMGEGGKSKRSPPRKSNHSKVFHVGGLFSPCLLMSGLFLYVCVGGGRGRVLFMKVFFTIWDTLIIMWAFFGLATPLTKMSADAHGYV